ncbi:PrsW family intramembrane metalloprotease [Nocardioides cavernae]|uniref:PrsW family intramembrane metalloprotease n=1 Tax=Nocardioides cavernae TaxID=1921566 RepID=A0ABR8NGB3_9ACTN|nr:PrsW family intramembrane metalloprotease [Nocardioides cavernae]MBD3927161.1 PrsW family intramembrane metalloprotease [Nocardioides cavernae]MBM7512881.1 RsiW-degrading membrane proteinase PrsW (M82 family) [Nocardioides cavernae]
MSTDTALLRRDAALDASAWGEPFHLVQPRNLCFWVYIVMVGYGVYSMLPIVSRSAHFSPAAVAAALVVNGILGLLWWLWFHHIDRWERQPAKILLAAFVWGAVPATFAIAINANGALMSLWAKWFGQDWAGHWQAALTAPFVEESAKFAGFLLLMGLAPRLVRTVNDGLILGAFIGLGFQVLEDVTYAFNGALENFGTAPVDGAIGTAWLRVATGFVSHPLYTALCCAGLVYLIGTASQERRIGRGLGFLAAGVLTHGLWDSMVAFAGSGAVTLLVMFGSAIFGLGVLWTAFKLARPVEHAYARDILAPEVEAGLLDDVEVEAVLDRKARKAYVHAGSDHHARRARKHLIHAGYELVHELVEARGAEDERVVRARAEVARFRSET